VLEKAFAKLKGGFLNIEGGQPSVALMNLIPYSTCADFKLDAVKTPADREALWEQIVRARKEKSLIAIASRGLSDAEKRDGVEGHADGITDHKLVAGHAFSVLRTYDEPNESEECNELRLINIRNPWGNLEPDFAWHDGDKKRWTPEMQKKVGYNPVGSGNDGVFWMCLADFVKHFQEVSILRRPVLATNPHASPRGVHHFGVARDVLWTAEMGEAIDNIGNIYPPIPNQPQLIIVPAKKGTFVVTADIDANNGVGGGAAEVSAPFEPYVSAFRGDDVRGGCTDSDEKLPLVHSWWSGMTTFTFELSPSAPGEAFAIVPFFDAGSESSPFTVSVVSDTPFKMSLLRDGQGGTLERVEGVEPVDGAAGSDADGAAAAKDADADDAAPAHEPHFHPLVRVNDVTEYHSCNVCSAEADGTYV